MKYIAVCFLVLALIGAAMSQFIPSFRSKNGGPKNLRIVKRAYVNEPFYPRDWYVYKKVHKRDVVDTSSADFTACLRQCLNQSVKHHYTIINYFAVLGKHYYHILLILMMGSTFLICLTGFLFMSKDVEIGAKLTFLALLVAIIAHTFGFNWYGEMIANDCFQVREMIYDTDWPDYSREFKSYLIIITAYLNKPIVLNAGGFMVCNLQTYGNVMSSAYSYFNLLSVMT